MRDFTAYEYGKAVKGTIFIFAGWRMSRLIYQLGIRRINKVGYKCILYIPSPELLAMNTPTEEIVLASEKAVALVNAYIADDPQPNQKYLTMGTSLGAAFAPRVAKECPAIRSLILVSAFGDLDAHMDLWLKHRYFGKVARSRPTSPVESVQILRQLSISTDLGRLKDKPVLIGYGLHDTLLHTHLVEELITELRAQGIELITKKVSGGHFLSMLKLSIWFQPKKLYFFD